MEKIGVKRKKSAELIHQLERRGDVMPLPSLSELFQEDIRLSAAWLRYIWQIPVSDIAIRTSDS